MPLDHDFASNSGFSAAVVLVILRCAQKPRLSASWSWTLNARVPLKGMKNKDEAANLFEQPEASPKTGSNWLGTKSGIQREARQHDHLCVCFLASWR